MTTDPADTGYRLLTSVLTGDATFMAKVSGVFQVIAPAGYAPDYCILQLQSATDTNSANAKRLLTRCLFQVKLVGPAEDVANLSAAYQRADALLQPGGLPLVNTDNTLACFREQALSYGEVRQDGTLWLHYGGLYRVEV